jgi:demethylmenaquinone methyltransferase/2-methoxy-6-polyprenyl-1,4-benzoquinol methylase
MRKGVQKIFSEVAESYQLVNHVLTFGLDILWRKKTAREAVKASGSFWLDVCSGTGEMALNLSRLAEKGIKIVTVDFCQPMLAKTPYNHLFCHKKSKSQQGYVKDPFKGILSRSQARRTICQS